VLIRRPSYCRLAALPAVGFAVLHAATLVVLIDLWPSFGGWRPDAVWGPAVGGIPLDEIVWAAVFGASWPLVAAYVIDLRFVPAEGREAIGREGCAPGLERATE